MACPVSDELDGLAEGIRNGSHESFHALYDRFADELVSFAYGMVRDRRTAEDIVQQTFVELVRGCGRFRGNGRALRSWLYRSARYGCLDEFRRRRRHPETPAFDLPEVAVEPDPMEHVLDPLLADALDALTERQRTMILLRHVVGMSGDEIAAVMSSPRTAVYAALGRAERRLRGLLEAAGMSGGRHE